MNHPPATERLRFRDWQPSDLEPFHAMCSDPQVMQFVGDGNSWSRERTAEFIARATEMSKSLGFCQWALIHKDHATLVGFCGFVPATNGGEIGWRLSPDYWGRGLVTEAALSAVTYGFETLGFQRIMATVQALNRGSIRVAEKLGMLRESSCERNGRELLRYSITPEVFRSSTSS